MIRGDRRTGVFMYVCLGGNDGKCGGSWRNVSGREGAVPSSSESSRSGEGERDAGGWITVLAFTRLISRRNISFAMDRWENAIATHYASSSLTASPRYRVRSRADRIHRMLSGGPARLPRRGWRGSRIHAPVETAAVRL